MFKRRFIVFMVSCFNTACFAYILLTYIYIYRNRDLLLSPIPQTIIQAAASTETFIKEQINDNLMTLNVLFLGYGGEGHSGGFLTDAIQILHINFSSKKAVLISVPRDLWVNSKTGKETKINSILNETTSSSLKNNPTNFISTGADNLKNTLSQITGLKIDYFIAIDFVGFMRTIGIELKGIEVNVAQTLEDPWYPIAGEEVNTCGLTPEEVSSLSSTFSGFELERKFPCRYKHLLFEKGLVHMEGGDALEYVRSRHGSGEGDIARGKRQQEVLIAVKDKFFNTATVDNLLEYYQNFTKHVQTDIGLDIFKHFAPLVLDSKEFTVSSINLAPTNVLSASTSNDKQAILIPKEGKNEWSEVKEFIQEQVDQK